MCAKLKIAFILLLHRTACRKEACLKNSHIFVLMHIILRCLPSVCEVMYHIIALNSLHIYKKILCGGIHWETSQCDILSPKWLFYHINCNNRNRGTWKGALIPGTLKDEWRRALGKRHLSARELHKGNLEGPGTPKDMLSKTLEMGVISTGAALWRNVEGRSFPRTFERIETFLYLGKFLWGIWEIYKKCLVYR
jgi:hypothetical protein